MKSLPHTVDEHRKYLHDLSRLMLWFAWHWAKAHPDEPFRNVISKRIDIFRKTDIHQGHYGSSDPDFDVPDWLKLENGVESIYSAMKDDADASAFEAEAFELFRVRIDAGTESHLLSTFDLDPARWQSGSLGYSAPREEVPATVCIHIVNAIQPRSIFEDPKYLPECLLDLLGKAETEYGADSIETGTWLNSHPGFLAMFPRTWQENMSSPNPEVRWSYAFWGQFINARGVFNGKHGDAMRRTGEFPYAYRSSCCRIDVLRAHLLGIVGRRSEAQS